MTNDEISVLYAVLCATWRRDPTDTELMGWHIGLRKLEPDVAAAGLELLITEDRPFMPRPGEFLEVCRKLTGDIPKKVNEALGAYQMGDLSDPLVAEAASGAYWDINGEKGETEVFRFKAAYEALLRRAEDGKLRPQRDALEAGETGGLMDMLGIPENTELEEGDE